MGNEKINYIEFSTKNIKVVNSLYKCLVYHSLIILLSKIVALTLGSSR